MRPGSRASLRNLTKGGQKEASGIKLKRGNRGDWRKKIVRSGVELVLCSGRELPSRELGRKRDPFCFDLPPRRVLVGR